MAQIHAVNISRDTDKITAVREGFISFTNGRPPISALVEKTMWINIQHLDDEKNGKPK